jgi:hypothetical protein
MRYLLCEGCDDRLPLRGNAVRCGCGRSSARRDGAGWAYGGPATVAIAMRVHEPEARRMAERLVVLPDDRRVHRGGTREVPA